MVYQRLTLIWVGFLVIVLRLGGVKTIPTTHCPLSPLLTHVSSFLRQKLTINENVSFTDHAFGIQLPDCSQINPWIGKMTMTSYVADMMSSSSFFHIAVFLLSRLVIGPSSISISLLVLELGQFSFIKDWPKIRKLEILPFEFCSISAFKLLKS